MRSLKTENVCREELLACRFCLATEGKLVNICENRLDQTFLELLGTEVSASDGLPQHACVYCRRLVAKLEEFRARSQRAQDLLRQLQRHAITTASIASINRFTHQLTSFTSQTCTTLIECEHQDRIIKHEDMKPEEVVVKHEDMDDDAEMEYDEVEIKLTSKRKRKVEKDVPREKKTPKEKKIKKMFDCEADFPAFESKYNMEIVVLTLEQQRENMLARKNSSNYTNSPHKCPLCFKGFSSEATFRNHHLKHHDPSVGAQQCELCHSRFRIPAFLRTHAETHRLKFVCRECRFVASNR